VITSRSIACGLAELCGDSDPACVAGVMCQTALLMLNEKDIDFTRHLVDYRDPPPWCTPALHQPTPCHLHACPCKPLSPKKIRSDHRSQQCIQQIPICLAVPETHTGLC
jgi:hypothetical protein